VAAVRNEVVPNTVARERGRSFARKAVFAYRAYIDSTINALMAHGQSRAAAAQEAVGRAYSTMQRQAAMLSYANAFWVLSIVMFFLVPLPFIMRKPPKLTKAPEGAGH